jgi:hypothetical protein
MQVTRVEVTDEEHRLRARAWLQCDNENADPSIDLTVDSVTVGGLTVDIGDRAVFTGHPYATIDVSGENSLSGGTQVVLEISSGDDWTVDDFMQAISGEV